MPDVLPKATPSPRHYDLVSASLHWTIAGLVLINIFATPQGETALEQAQAVETHFTIGLLILVLMCPRLLWRLAHPAPPFPKSVKGRERSASTLVHWAFYIALFAMGVIGVVQAAVAPFAVEFFGVLPLPAVALANEALYGQLTLSHQTVNLIVLGLLLLHIGAALYHAFVVKDGVLRSMLPW